MARKIRSDSGLKKSLQSRGYAYIPWRNSSDGSDEAYGDCVMTKAYVQRPRTRIGRWDA